MRTKNDRRDHGAKRAKALKHEPEYLEGKTALSDSKSPSRGNPPPPDEGGTRGRKWAERRAGRAELI